jgi:hypothetical protein
MESSFFSVRKSELCCSHLHLHTLKVPVTKRSLKFKMLKYLFRTSPTVLLVTILFVLRRLKMFTS